MKVIYIAGPYRGSCEFDVRMNIRKAEEEALFVWSCGGVALCPHKNTAGFGGAYGIPDKVWLEGDIELLSRCDAIYTIHGWRSGFGAFSELEIAQKKGITVLYDRNSVFKYLKDEEEK